MSGAARISESLSNIVIMQVVINNQTIHNLNTISIHLSKKEKTSFFKYYFQPITAGMDFVSPPFLSYALHCWGGNQIGSQCRSFTTCRSFFERDIEIQMKFRIIKFGKQLLKVYL